MDIQLLTKIKETSGTNDKIFLSVTGFNDDEHMYMTECFNKVVYGISKTNITKAIGYDKGYYGKFDDLGEFLITRPNGGYDILEGSNSICEFKFLPEFLKEIENTSGDNQIQVLQDLLKQIKPELRPYFIRVLLKDPRMGISLTTYNTIRVKCKMVPIKEHIVKLAELLIPENFHKLPYPVLVDTKLDGLRGECEVVDNKVVAITSRNGLSILKEYPEVVRDIESSLEVYKEKISCVFDMEIVSSSFNALQKRMNRLEENLNTDFDLTFVVFDLIGYNDVDLSDKPLHYRLQILSDIKKFIDNNHNVKDIFKISEARLVNDAETLLKIFTKAMDDKEEGIMVKTPESKLAKKKEDREDWWKVKETHNADLLIVGAAYGNGRNKDFINILYVEDKTRFIRSKVSSGMTDETRALFTKLNNEDKLVGKIVEIKYNNITSKNSLRHPVIIQLRFDKDEIDCLLEMVK